MKRVALIGSEGYIGKHLYQFLLDRGYLVSCYDILDVKREEYTQCDLSKREQVSHIDLNVDYVYMFAGMTGTKVGFAKYKTYIEANELSLLNLMSAIAESSYRPQVIFPSSRLVYKGKEEALPEDGEKETKTVYAVNKIACENILYAYANYYGIPYTIYRICVPFGNMLARDYSFGTVGFFIRQASEKHCITLYGDGSIRRTFTSMADLCKQIVSVSENKESINEVFNVGGVAHSLKEVAEMIAVHYNANLSLIPFPEDDLKIESGPTFFDSTKIEKISGLSDYEDIDSLIID